MTLPQVAFHSGVSDPVLYACRLLRKAWRQRARVLVQAPPPTLAALDAALWTFEAQEFIPHLCLPAPEPRLARTPIWLSSAELPAELRASAPRIRVGIGGAAVTERGDFDRLIEIVGVTPEARAAARRSWRHYEQEWGLVPTHHVASA